MNALCPICAIDASSHSFDFLYCVDGVNVFYTCPANAIKYNDKDGILLHFKLALDHYKCADTYWKWIFDFRGFELKHLIEINMAIGIAGIIHSYSNYLTQIQIINTNGYTYSMMQLVTPFLNESIKDKIYTQ